MVFSTSGAPSRSWTPARVDDKADQQAQRVGEDVPLAAIDLLAGVEAVNPAALGGFHALAVDHPGCRTCLPTLQLPRIHDQMVVDRPPQPAVAPVVEIPLHGRWRRQVPRQHAPLAARRRHVKDRVHNLPQVGRARPSDPTRQGQERRNQRPFPIRHVACIARPRRACSRRAVSSQGIVPPSVFPNRRKSQPYDIAQLISGRALTEPTSS